MTVNAKVWNGSAWVGGTAPSSKLLPYRPTSVTDPTPNLVTVATNATINTKGSWVELIASTAVAADGILLKWFGNSASNVVNNTLCDIAFGATGSESVVVANMALAAPVNLPHGAEVPIAVPINTRISVRWQTGRASAAAATIGADLLKYPSGSTLTSPSTIDTIGANTATSAGVSYGTTNNAIVQITASTSQAYRGIVVLPQSGDSSMVNSYMTCDLAVGVSGSEVLYSTGVLYNISGNELVSRVGAGGSTYVEVAIPSGTRLSVRLTDALIASNSAYNVVLLGVPA